MNKDFIGVILLLVLGFLMAWKPKLLWKIEHVFTVKDGEPTEMYLAFMRIGGIFFIFCAIFAMVYAIKM